jgi:pimeloyl-ACP methyl ester carboxylesterase
MRAMYPDTEGFIVCDGVTVGYEVFGAGEPAIVLLTSWAIIHARQWKAQVPYLARRFRVITVEGRGNGRAGRPASPAAYPAGGEGTCRRLGHRIRTADRRSDE